MQVLKYDDNLRQALIGAVGGKGDKAYAAIAALAFDTEHGWTVESLAVHLFMQFEESFYDYGDWKLMLTYLPEEFLPSCLSYLEKLEVVYPDCLDQVFESVAIAYHLDDIRQFALDIAEQNEEDPDIDQAIEQSDSTQVLRLSKLTNEWLRHVVESAISEYNEPITVGIYQEGGHCL